MPLHWAILPKPRPRRARQKRTFRVPPLARAISRLLQSAPLQAPFQTLALLGSEPRLAIELFPANRPNKGTVEAANIAKLRHKAEQGDANARNELGVALAAGRGIARGDLAAVNHFRSGGEAGLMTALANLGLLLAQNRGVQERLSKHAVFSPSQRKQVLR